MKTRFHFFVCRFKRQLNYINTLRRVCQHFFSFFSKKFFVAFFKLIRHLCDALFSSATKTMIPYAAKFVNCFLKLILTKKDKKNVMTFINNYYNVVNYYSFSCFRYRWFYALLYSKFSLIVSLIVSLNLSFD